MKIGNQTYLLRGMCSNGPEVGIVPHKSLLETSLKKIKEQDIKKSKNKVDCQMEHWYGVIEH